ncbi:MAG: phosphatidate cytidylyltransferase [Clostridiales Family XIII bacterium]|jgi:phosphatidate cytidylyltransferase|nr:phosphatidate cytidylyltransferase [Clostridiales Family XIII bacterium]
MKTRVLSGFIMLPLLVVVYFGGYVLDAACLVLSILGVREFYNAFTNANSSESGKKQVSQPIRPLISVAVICTIFLYATTLFLNTSFIVMWLFLTVALSFLCMFRTKKHDVRDAFVTLIGNVYVVFFLFHVVLIGYYFQIESGWVQGMKNPVWLVLFTAFGTDIFAYFAGVALGKHKLCPNISPKKTVEGSIGGILGSTLLCGVFGYFFLPHLFIHCIFIGIFGSIFSQVGDLTASAIKRKLGIKDYGRLIPGHGGILDRFDSVLYTAPFVFYYLNIYNSIVILQFQAGAL